MNLRHLADFFRGQTSADMILNEINSEVEDYRRGFGKTGSSLPIHATQDDFKFVIGREDVKKLCDLYLKGIFDEWHLQYISNSIELTSSFSVSDERVGDAIFRMADPEVNSPLTVETVREIRDEV